MVKDVRNRNSLYQWRRRRQPEFEPALKIQRTGSINESKIPIDQPTYSQTVANNIPLNRGTPTIPTTPLLQFTPNPPATPTRTLLCQHLRYQVSSTTHRLLTHQTLLVSTSLRKHHHQHVRCQVMYETNNMLNHPLGQQ